jgi:hypothetical protein
VVEKNCLELIGRSFLYVMDSWKTKKLSYEERKEALISRLNALNEEGDE